MNKKKNVKNVVFSLLSQLIILSVGMIVPRVILTHYGSDTNGLTSTITQILSYMALLEAGIGQATTNALYRYIHGADKDKEKISDVMSISRRYYRKVTLLYAFIVIVLAVILPQAIKTSVTYWTVFFIILFEGMTGVVSFWFIQSWTALLLADGRNYIQANIELVNKTLCYGIKIALAIFGLNLAFIQVGYFIVSLLKLGLYKRYMDKHYSWVVYSRNVKGEELKDRNSYVITEIAWTVFSSSDMIIISIFCSTQLSSVYSIYNMVFVALNSLLISVYNSVKFNLGQAYFNNTDDYRKIHDLFNSIFMALMTTLMIVAYYLIIPFVELYTSGVRDINYIIESLPLLFCLVQMISWSRYVAGNLTAIAGYANKTRNVSIIEAALNVIFSLILVSKFGIVGVLLATVIALPVKAIYCNYLSDYKIMYRSPYRTISILGINWLYFIVAVIAHRFVDIEITSFSYLILYGFIFVVVFGALVAVANCIVNRDVLNEMKKLLKRRI